MSTEQHPVLHSIDFGAVVISFAGLMDYAPKVATLLSIVWLATRLYEYGKDKYLKWKNK